MHNTTSPLFLQRCERVDAHSDGVATATPVVPLATSRHRRIYIAGPMTGLPDLNYPQAEALRAVGYHAENPAEHGIVEHAEWADYLRYDLGRMVTCESIFLLPGWEKSNGARLEVSVAKALGLVFIHHAEAKYVTDVEATDLEILEAAYAKAGQREHELRLLLVERNERIATLTAALQGAQEWLQGWASAEPYLSEINKALAPKPSVVELQPIGIDSEGGSHD